MKTVTLTLMLLTGKNLVLEFCTVESAVLAARKLCKAVPNCGRYYEVAGMNRLCHF